MPWTVWELPAKPEKPKPTIKLSSTGISISRSAWAAHGLDGAAHVLLHINENHTAIGISKADSGAKNAFKAGNKGRSADTVFVACGKALKDWGIVVDPKSNTSELEQIEGMAGFLLPKPKRASVGLSNLTVTPNAPTERRKPGRKPKAA